MKQVWTKPLDKALLELRKAGGSYEYCASVLENIHHWNCSPDSCRSRYRALTRTKADPKAGIRNTKNSALKRQAAATGVSAPPDGSTAVHERWTEDGDNREVVLTSRTIRTLEDLHAYVEVDLKVWEPHGFEANKWEVGAKDLNGVIQTTPLFQVKCKYRRIAKLAVQLDQLRLDLLADIRAEGKAQAATVVRPLFVSGTTDVMVEFSLPDIHLNKVAWPEETGMAYDIEIAEASFRTAMLDLLQKASGFNPERSIVPMGNDFFHIDNRQNQTTAGTPQDADTRYFRMIRRGRLLYAWALKLIAKEIGPVLGVSVPGNHDKISATFLSEMLAVQFEEHPFISIDTGLYPRKYVHHGAVLLGFAHGNEENVKELPLMMAQEQPLAWSRTTHREWHLGHLHKMKETRTKDGDSFQGVRVRILPSLSGTDAWHAGKGYTCEPRAAEAYLWSANHGYIGHLNHTARSERDIPLLVA